MKISKSEFKYIIFSALFALAWFFIVFPLLENSFQNSSPYIQFLIFNIGLYAFFFIFLKSRITNTLINLKTSLGLISIFLALDTFLPEYHVKITGELVKGGIMGTSSTDYIFGYLASNIGLSGVLIAFFTYFIAPVLLLIISAIILEDFINKI